MDEKHGAEAEGPGIPVHHGVRDADPPGRLRENRNYRRTIFPVLRGQRFFLAGLAVGVRARGCADGETAASGRSRHRRLSEHQSLPQLSHFPLVMVLLEKTVGISRVPHPFYPCVFGKTIHCRTRLSTFMGVASSLPGPVGVSLAPMGQGQDGGVPRLVPALCGAQGVGAGCFAGVGFPNAFGELWEKMGKSCLIAPKAFGQYDLAGVSARKMVEKKRGAFSPCTSMNKRAGLFLDPCMFCQYCSF